MNDPQGIPVTVYLPAHGSNADAIVREVEALLRSLVERDEGGSIDLQGLPLSPDERAQLADELGAGEVYAEVDAMGPTTIYETALPGVWWVTHHNESAQAIGEFLEVAYCPEILIAPVEDVREGWEGLKARLLEHEYRRNRRRGDDESGTE